MTMTLSDLLAPTDVLCGLRVADKRALLDDMARRAARALALDRAAAALRRREYLGSIGVGGGVALPHARMDAVPRPYALLARLLEPVEYDAVDERPLDLVCLVLLPSAGTGDHLNALACVARRLRRRVKRLGSPEAGGPPTPRSAPRQIGRARAGTTFVRDARPRWPTAQARPWSRS